MTPQSGSDIALEILEGDVDDELLLYAVDDREFEDGLWFRPGELWLEGRELISYSWARFSAHAKRQPPGVDLSTLPRPTGPRIFDEPADGIDPADMLVRLTQMVNDHVGLTIYGVDDKWFRAVQLGPTDELSPSRLGAAPPKWAAENRMSAAGQSMFYGATDADTARAEFRAAPEQPRTVVGTWAATRPLKLLDLANLPKPPSFFDVDQAWRRDFLMSLEQFGRDISVPVLPGDPPDIAYRPTQAFTDHLRRYLPGIDGIVNHSSKNGKPCCVLFADNSQSGSHLDPSQPNLLLTLESSEEADGSTSCTWRAPGHGR